VRRLFWLGAGIAIGVLVMRRLAKIAEQLTPKGIVDSFGGAVSDFARDLGGFFGDVRASMSEREQELREGTGLDAAPSRVSANGTNGRVHR
jgi:Family of unknown function (DUF6167)